VDSSYYQKYGRGQKHGIGQFRRFRIFSRQSRNEPPATLNPTATMITVTLVLAALSLLTATDDSAARSVE